MKNPLLKLLIILGPTSSGKTALSIQLAKKYNGEIISADSRQVYKGLDLGTGKVTKKEMAGVPHHLLDVANPKQIFTVSDYKALADIAIQDIHSRGKLPILVGGTGFYIDTVTSGMVLPEVAINKKLRAVLEKLDINALSLRLEKIDPVRAESIDRKNKVRLVRAIEVATALGKVPSLQKLPAPYQTLKIGLDMPDELLKDRIDIRLKERIKAGMLKEASQLHTKGLSWKRMEALGLEYRAMANLLRKKIEKKEFEVRLALDIWHYAKRQRTWFRRDKKIAWFNPMQKSSVKEINATVKNFIA